MSHLLFYGERCVLILFQNLGQALTAGELRLRDLVQVGSELGKCREFSKLRQVQSKRTGDLTHGFDLSIAANARYRNTYVHRRPDSRVEQIALKEDLSICN